MARKTNAALALALSAALALGTVPAPALAQMAEEPMDTEPMTVEDEARLALQAEESMAEEPIVETEANTQISAQAATASAPRVRADSSKASGQVATWDCVWFGSYPQAEVSETTALAGAAWDAHGDATVDGVRYRRISRKDVTYKAEWQGDWPKDAGEYRYFRYEPVKWRVLEVSGSTALVMADRGLDARRYNEDKAVVTWSTSSIRSWLNGYGASDNQPGVDYSSNNFIAAAFSPAERDAVLQSKLANADGTYSGAEGGPDTTDRVFLLSEADVSGDAATARGFASHYNTADEARRCCEGTNFARAMGIHSPTEGDYVGYCHWWLRSPGAASNYATRVWVDGSVDQIGYYVNNYYYAVRPALRLNLSSPLVKPAGTVSSDGAVSETTPEPVPAKTFPDVPAGAWYAGVVSRAAGLGLISGYADGRFGPADKVTRGQVAAILWNMAGKPAAGSGARSFPDVAADKYYYNAVRWASSAGVVSGYGSGKFGPDDQVTREQLAVMLANYARNVARRQVAGSAADYAKMRDGAKVSSWAQASVGWCFRNQIISGTKDGNVNPKGNATRAEAAKMVVYLHDML